MAFSSVLQIWKDQVLVGQRSWQTLQVSGKQNQQWQSVDCVLANAGGTGKVSNITTFDDLQIAVVYQGNSTLLEAKSFGTTEKYEFFLKILLNPTVNGQESLVRFIIPLEKGYIVRPDAIPIRLQDCPHIQEVKSFCRPLHTFENKIPPTMILENDDVSVPTIFAAATACIVLQPVAQKGLETILSKVDEELQNRLSFPWIIPETPRERTLALVEANSSHPEDGLGLYNAAAALGIKLVVLDEDGHWLGKPENAHACEAFIPTQLTNPPQPEMKDHILASLRAYGKPVDGIITFADTYWPYVAEAAIVLGIPTAPPEAFKVATNKYHTSVFSGRQAYHASSLEEALRVAQQQELPYPLIVKPCGGWSSEGVYRVETRSALEDAARAIFASRHGFELVIEPYCDGPEVDVNLVLQDGQLIFFEVCDDFPKSADVNGPSVGSLNNFHELCSVYPSKLPEAEIELLREDFLAKLLSLGLKNGVFHLEGRIENSTVEYTNKDGVIELSRRADADSRSPKPWLIEINPRPLGMTGSQIIESTYGIDYWGLALLLAVGDKTRALALSRPFVQGPQYTSAMVFIPADFSTSCGGIFDSDDVCADLLARQPDLKAHISRCGCLIKRGQQVPHPSTGRNTFVAYFNVFSRNSRGEALDIANRVREEVKYSFI